MRISLKAGRGCFWENVFCQNLFMGSWKYIFICSSIIFLCNFGQVIFRPLVVMTSSATRGDLVTAPSSIRVKGSITQKAASRRTCSAFISTYQDRTNLRN